MELGMVALLLLGGFFAGFANIVAGGGSLITLPLLIVAGVSPGIANGSTRVAILVQNLVAVWRYQRSGAVEWRELRRWLPAVLAGALIGAWVSAELPDQTFQRVLGIVTLACAVPVALDFNALLARLGVRPERPAWLGQTAMFVTGLFGGLVQAGVGFVIVAALTLAAGMSLVRANVLKVTLVLVYAPLAAGIFVLEGKVDWTYAALLAVGQASGGWLGAGMSQRGGARLIRGMTAVIVLLSALELLGVLDIVKR